jgi:hypothetical protein
MMMRAQVAPSVSSAPPIPVQEGREGGIWMVTMQEMSSRAGEAAMELVLSENKY